MEWLIKTIQEFPGIFRGVFFFLLAIWTFSMFLLPFNVARTANHLSEIKKLFEQMMKEQKTQMENLGAKFDISNLVMSDFFKFKQDMKEGKQNGYNGEK